MIRMRNGTVSRAKRAQAPTVAEPTKPSPTSAGKALSKGLRTTRPTIPLVSAVPPSVVTLLQVPGLGPKTAGELWRQANISTLDQLEAAASAGTLRELKGMTAKTEERILKSLAELRKRPPRRIRLGQAEEAIERVTRSLKAIPTIKSITPAGSWRRRRAGCRC